MVWLFARKAAPCKAEDDHLEAVAAVLRLSAADLRVLRTAFHDAGNGSRVVGRFDLLTRLECDPTPFALRIFKEAEVDLAEFVAAVHHFCTLDRAEVRALAFSCFATAEGGLSEGDRAPLLDSLFGGAATAPLSDRTEAHLAALADDDGALNKDRWLAWAASNPKACAPLLLVQRQLRKRCGGDRFWAKRSKQAGDRQALDDAVAAQAMMDAVSPVVPSNINNNNINNNNNNKGASRVSPLMMVPVVEEELLADEEDHERDSWGADELLAKAADLRRKFAGEAPLLPPLSPAEKNAAGALVTTSPSRLRPGTPRYRSLRHRVVRLASEANIDDDGPDDSHPKNRRASYPAQKAARLPPRVTPRKMKIVPLVAMPEGSSTD